MRCGKCFKASCANVATLSSDLPAWVGICRYLGVYFSSDRTFKCGFDNSNLASNAHLMQFAIVVLRLK